MTEKNTPFVIKQLEEALEERQNSDRRKAELPVEKPTKDDRRQNDRRKV